MNMLTIYITHGFSCKNSNYLNFKNFAIIRKKRRFLCSNIVMTHSYSSMVKI